MKRESSDLRVAKPAARRNVVTAARWILTVVAVHGPFGGVASSQMPKEDVVDVPAIGAGLCVSNLFQTNMVLQRDRPIGIWGWATLGETVTVTLGDDEQTVTADRDRRWRVTLRARPANATPARITIQGSKDSLVLDNVLIGDVWVLGGQSNMEFELAKVENGPLEIVSANFPNLRILTVPYGVGEDARTGFARLDEWSDWFGRHFRKGDWDVCSPDVAKDLSAIGYVFARRLQMATQIPIGVIDASRGGTTVETWTPRSVLWEMDSAPVREKLAEWDTQLVEWNAQEDLARRVAQHQERIARLEAEGKPIPTDQQEAPGDLRPGPIADPNYPGNSFAGMIGPLRGLSIKGAIFHQGYNNALDGMRGVRLYEDVFPVMIEAWRDAFSDPALPFGILSLCTDGDPQTREDYLEKMLNAGIYVRAAQYRTFLDLYDGGDRNIGFASTYDLRRRWYHPQLKTPAGERIARWALSTQYGYGQTLPWTPPRLVGMEVQDGALLLRMDGEVGDPQDGAIEGFAIAGSDRRFQPAYAAYLEIGKDDRGRPRFDKKQLVLTSPLVLAPIHFRYAWGRNPLANLQLTGNKDLPFATQRSDDWDMGTVPLGVLDEAIEGKMSRAQSNRVLKALQAEDRRRRLAEARAVLEALGGSEGDDP